LLSVGNEIAHLEAVWKGRLGRLERSLVGLLCDRTASALARVQISEGLVRAATREERLRLADELHDSYLQTLAAVDLHVEAIRAKLGAGQSDVDEKLIEVKQIARRAAKEARETFTPLQEFENYGRDEVLETFATRWAGTSRIRIPESLELEEDQWRVIALMAKEGLHNASKHGRASHVEFSAQDEPDTTVFRLSQTGNMIEGQIRFGYGLSRLKEAVEREGGVLGLENGEQAGTVLTVSLPKRA
jgi:signal transduction histidine kinase